MSVAIAASMLTILTSSPDAGKLFEAGRTAMKAGKINEACRAFEGSYVADPALGTLLNLADCLEKQKKFASAFTRFNEATAWAQRTKEADREKFSSSRAKELKPKLSWLALSTNEPCTVEVSGNTVELDKLPLSIPLDIGSHTVSVKKAGFEQFSATLSLTKEDETKKIVVELVAIPQPKTVVVDIPGDAPEASNSSERLDPALQIQPVLAQNPVVMVTAPSQAPATAFMVTGGVLAVGGTVALLWCTALYDKAQAQRKDGPGTGEILVTQSELESLKWMYPSAIVTASVGALALGAGVVMLVTQKPVAVIPTVSKESTGLSVFGRF
jgi:hypothetical protein